MQIFLHVVCNFLPPEELPPHEKKVMSAVIEVYKFGQKIFTIGIFLEIRRIPVKAA